MAMDKPDVIKYIEQKTGAVLKELPLVEGGIFKKEEWGGSRGYALNEDGAVIALTLDGIPGTYFDLKEVASNLVDLKRLSLWRAYYPDYSFLSNFKDLTALCLRSNNLKDASALSELKGLTWLDLSNNNLKDASALSELKGLTWLDLRYNNLTDASFLSELKGLNRLDLSDNNLTDAFFLSELKGLTSLELRYNNLTDASFLSELKGLTSLYLRYNKQIGDYSFLSELKGLTRLDLSNNKQIGDYSFLSELKGLTRLDLSNNKQISDYSFLSELKGLTRLDLSNNNLTDASFLSELKGLTRLDLSYNNLTDAFFLSELKGLTSLDLSNNKQRADYSFLSELKGLTRLDLSSNNLTDASFLSELKGLTRLDLRANNLTDAFFLSELKGLTRLYLSYNNLKDAFFLSELKGLTSLNLRANNLSDASFLSELKGLTRLDLRANNLSDASFLSELKGLTWLDLSSNKQISDYSFLSELKGLTRLDLRDNKQISDYSFLSELKGLTTLDLSYNKQRADYSFLSELKGLTTLDLRDNKQISDYSFLSELKGLTRLDLSNNNLKDASFLSELKGLTTLDLRNNNLIETPPPEVVNKGLEAIRNYFEQLEEQGAKKLYEAKVLFVGEGGTGKTSLMKKLLDNEYEIPNKTESTLGLVVENGWSFDYCPDPAIPFKANLWDFGGQEIQYLTHQFFLTPRSLYVLLLDDRREHQRLDYWMSIINLLSDGSPVLVVQNEKGSASLNVFELAKFKKIFPKLPMEYMPVDLATEKDSDGRFLNIQQRIQSLVCELPHIGSDLPKQWVVIREALDQLREEGKHYIAYQEFLDLCAANQMEDEEDCLFLSQHLHDLGVILHYKNDAALYNLIILDPHWAVDAVYLILKNVKDSNSHGRFSKQKLDEIWIAAGYIKMAERTHLLNMMLKDRFEVCYRAKTQDQSEVYISPQLLPGTEPDFNWDHTTHRFLFRYDFLPKGILSRLIVRLHHIICEVNENPMIWKEGAYFKQNDCHAKVVEEKLRNDGRQMIRIEIDGPSLAGKLLLRDIRAEIQAIHEKSFPNIAVEQMIPCDCEECAHAPEPHFYPLSTLQKAVKKGVREWRCGLSFEESNIDDLLRNVFFDEEFKHQTEMEETSKAFSNLKLFYSYSKDDLDLKKELDKHLSTLKRNYGIRTWYDREIIAGQEWDKRIKEELRSADIVLFLVSASSLATKYIMETELPIIEERQAVGACTFVPVILRPCDWGEEEFSKYQALPEKGLPVTKWADRDDAWLSVVKGVRKAILEQGAKK